MKSWRSARFDEIFERVDRKFLLDDSEQYKCVGVRWYGMGAFVREHLPGVDIARKQQCIIRSGDIVYNKLFAWKGAFAIADQSVDGCIVSDKFPTYRANDEQVDKRWLWYYFRTPKLAQQAEALSKGAAAISKLTLNPPQFWDLTIPLPPAPEQRRIVARIEALAVQIQEARTLRRQAQTEINILLVKQIESFFLPYQSQMVSIGDVFRVTTGGTPSRANPVYWNGNVNWVSSGEVAFCRIRQTHEKITHEGVENSNAKVNPPSTVLLAMIGQGKTRGQCAILDCCAATNQNVAAIHVYETDHLAEYVYWWLFGNYQKSRATETGTAQPALSGQRVKQIRIPIPSIDEQCRIVAELNALQAHVDSLKKLQAETAAELDALLPSVLDKAFKGEL